MGFKKIKKGDILEVKGKKYKVVHFGGWFDQLSSGKKRWWSNVEMIELGSGKLTKTHILGKYQDTGEIFIINELIDFNKKEKLKKDDVKVISYQEV